jgi:hypothetical protein
LSLYLAERLIMIRANNNASGRIYAICWKEKL